MNFFPKQYDDLNSFGNGTFRIEERMQARSDVERFQGHSVLTAYDLWPGERYHAERLVKLGFLKKTTSRAPWNGSQPAVMYYIDEACPENPLMV